jgi:membrane protease YdiL (CAAX protease family)
MARPHVPRANSLPLDKSDLKLYFAVTAVLVFAFAVISPLINTSCDGPAGHPRTCITTLPLVQLLVASVIIEAAGLIAIALKHRQGAAWFGFVKAPVKLTVQLVLGGVAIIAAMELLTALLGHYLPFFRQAEYGVSSVPAGVTLLEFGLFAVLVAPVLEEFLFRGVYFRAIWTKTGPVAAAIISSLVFTLAHGISGATLAVFVLGLYLCYMYKRSGSIIPGMILHTTNNLFAVMLLSFGVR